MFKKPRENWILFQLNNVTPTGCGIFALKILFHGVREDIGTAFTAWFGVLLGTDDDGFGAVELVDAIYDGIEAFQLLNLLGIHIKQVLLDGAVGRDAHL